MYTSLLLTRLSPLRLKRELHLVQMLIEPATSHELFMCSLFDDAAAV